jgi:threonine synthase
MPTGSFKDRGASVLVSKVKELGIKRVVIDSSGNAGCAVAAYAARAGIRCEVYVPDATSPVKLKQIAAYGARVIKIRGSREETAAAALDAARHTYYASHYWNPFFLQGTKTFAFEVWEQLQENPPDTIVLPVGNGTLVLGAGLGFGELYRDRQIRRRPKIVAVQARACSPLVKAFRENLKTIPAVRKKPTMAEGIAINAPTRGRQIIQAVRSTGGMFLEVTEKEIAAALRAMLRQGFYIEPTAAVAIAGTARYLHNARPNETVVTVFTGHGLKSLK